MLETLNRPTVGYSVCAVPPGAVVLEEGYQNQTQGGSSPGTSTTYPQGFERVGIAKGLEADVIGPNLNIERSGTTRTAGFNDMGLGFKYEFDPKTKVTYAVDGLFTVPTGTSTFSDGRPSQTLNIDVSYAASPAVAFGTTLAGATTGGFTPGGTFGSYGFFQPSFVVTADIPQYYQFYAEFVAQTKIGPDQGGKSFTDFGVQKLLGPYVELDAEYAIDFTPLSGSRYRYLGIGTGIRLR